MDGQEKSWNQGENAAGGNVNVKRLTKRDPASASGFLYRDVSPTQLQAQVKLA